MKRIILLSVIVGAAIIFWVFGLKGTLDYSTRQQIIARKSIKTIVKALNIKDADLLKSVFSEQALEDAYNMDEGIEYIFSLYEGECEKVEQMPWASGTDSFGKASVMLGFDLMFNGKKFELYYSQTTKNMGNKKAIGIKYMSFLPADFDDESISNIKLPGIYNPVWDDYYINEWRHSDEYDMEEVEKQAKREGALEIHLDGSKYKNVEDIIDDMGKQFRLPKNNSENEDKFLPKLEDFTRQMENLSWIPEEHIVVYIENTTGEFMDEDEYRYTLFVKKITDEILPHWQGHPRDNANGKIVARDFQIYMMY